MLKQKLLTQLKNELQNLKTQKTTPLHPLTETDLKKALNNILRDIYNETNPITHTLKNGILTIKPKNNPNHIYATINISNFPKPIQENIIHATENYIKQLNDIYFTTEAIKWLS